jgi:hypothetical protein
VVLLWLLRTLVAAEGGAGVVAVRSGGGAAVGGVGVVSVRSVGY